MFVNYVYSIVQLLASNSLPRSRHTCLGLGKPITKSSFPMITSIVIGAA